MYRRVYAAEHPLGDSTSGKTAGHSITANIRQRPTKCSRTCGTQGPLGLSRAPQCVCPLNEYSSGYTYMRQSNTCTSGLCSLFCVLPIDHSNLKNPARLFFSSSYPAYVYRHKGTVVLGSVLYPWPLPSNQPTESQKASQS